MRSCLHVLAISSSHRISSLPFSSIFGCFCVWSAGFIEFHFAVSCHAHQCHACQVPEPLADGHGDGGAVYQQQPGCLGGQRKRDYPASTLSGNLGTAKIKGQMEEKEKGSLKHGIAPVPLLFKFPPSFFSPPPLNFGLVTN